MTFELEQPLEQQQIGLVIVDNQDPARCRALRARADPPSQGFHDGLIVAGTARLDPGLQVLWRLVVVGRAAAATIKSRDRPQPSVRVWRARRL